MADGVIEFVINTCSESSSPDRRAICTSKRWSGDEFDEELLIVLAGEWYSELRLAGEPNDSGSSGSTTK